MPEPCQATVLFGAGASVEAGVPLGMELATEIRTAVDDRCPPEALQAWDYLSASGVNFEEVYRLARNLVSLHDAGLLDDSDPVAAHVAGARQLAGHAEDHRRFECAGDLLPIVSGLLGRAPGDVSYLDPLADLIARQNRVVVATLNYDSVVETWASKHAHGFLQDDDPGRWSPGDRWFEPQGQLQLLKLHGSADWAWTSHQPVARREFAPPTVQRHREPTPSTDPAMIFGAGNKLRPGGPFLALLDAFSAALGSSDHLVVVGYSFCDVHVNIRIEAWFDRDPSSRFITVVAPHWLNKMDDDAPLFAQVLHHRLKQQPAGHIQVNSQRLSTASPEPRMRVVQGTAGERLAEALSCPPVLASSGGSVALRARQQGRTYDVL